MTTPKTRDREARRPDAREQRLEMGRTARMLEADKRVARLSLNEDGTKVLVTLNPEWRFPADGIDGIASQGRAFTLWEAARNAVRRSEKVEA